MASRENYIKYKGRHPAKVNESKRKWEEKNPEAHARIKLRTRAKRQGVDPDVAEEYIREHNGLCDLCGDPPGQKALAFDHCHRTNKFRGLLCGRCNTGLGQFLDDPTRLLKAIEYLRQQD